MKPEVIEQLGEALQRAIGARDEDAIEAAAVPLLISVATNLARIAEALTRPKRIGEPDWPKPSTPPT